MKNGNLFRSIDQAFPLGEIPSEEDFFETSSASNHDYNLFLEASRSKNSDCRVANLLHQELYFLSPISIKWALRYFLKYGLNPDSEYSQSEIEFLIYALAPTKESEDNVKLRLSLLSKNQIDCLISFVLFIRGKPFWSDFFPEDIERALDFLRSFQAAY